MRPLSRALAALAVIALACSTPTDVCGCPPARSAVVVAGTVADAAGAPVAGARILLDAVPLTLSSEPPIAYSIVPVTDAAGAFAGRAYSLWADDEQALRAAVVRPGTADTVRLRLGAATLRPEHGRLDTVRVALRLP